MSTRPIKWREAYRGLRNEGCDWLTCAVIATLWVMRGVELEETP
jgi:hypothetical protein